MRTIVWIGIVLAAAATLGVRSAMAAAPGAGDAAKPPTLVRSDVVFMYDNPKLYRDYGCTVLGWAGGEDPKRVAEAHAAGVRLFCASVGFRTEAAGVIDYTPDFLDAACRNFSDKPFVVPWLWDMKHKGQSAWWWCTNSPVYRRYLDHRIQSMMKADLDGLHIDDYTGTAGAVTWLSACFCRHCMTQFRDYLAAKVSPERAAAMGIPDLRAFDYRQLLLSRGVLPETYNNRRSGLPFAAEFHDFQVKAADRFVAEYRRRAEKLRGRPLALCVNSAINEPAALVVAPHVTFFCCEVEQHASARKAPIAPVATYKLADGLARPVTATAGGWDWAYVNQHKLHGLVRTWIALAYAEGHFFMAPHYQWCYTQEKGTHWYHGPTEQFAPLYRFVRDNARLFDGYEAIAPVAVVYDNTLRRRGMGDIVPICTALAERNVPFTVVVGGDDWLDYRLDPARLETFQKVVVCGEQTRTTLDAAQQEAIGRVRRKGTLLDWSDEKKHARALASLVQVAGSSQVGVVPRGIPGDAAAPVVVHLLNRQYDGSKDAMVAQRDFVVKLHRDALGGRNAAKAILREPTMPPRELPVAWQGDVASVRVPELSLWALLELQP
jgi:hypothetical protein